MTGYKGMIRDRMPETWVFILKYFKCLNKWIDMVYNDRLKGWNTHWNPKERSPGKSLAVKHLVSEEFILSFPLKLSDAERKKWYAIAAWEKWFRDRFLYIKQDYDFALRLGENPIDKIYNNWKLPIDFIQAIIIYIKNGQRA